MRLKRNSGAVLVETALFAGMVGVVSTTLMMVLFAKTMLVAAMIGGVVAAVVFVAMWLMMLGTLEPARGPGNIPRNAAASKPLSAPAAKTASPATKAAAPAPKAKSVEAKPTVEEAPAAVGTAPARLTAARESGPDDLKLIKGVGPKLEKLLHSMGFYHFDQVADWTADEVAWVDENLTGFKGRVTRDNWVAQAKTLAQETT